MENYSLGIIPTGNTLPLSPTTLPSTMLEENSGHSTHNHTVVLLVVLIPMVIGEVEVSVDEVSVDEEGDKAKVVGTKMSTKRERGIQLSLKSKIFPIK